MASKSEEKEPSPKRQKKDVAEDLKCPISWELPCDPVTAEDGRVYERSEIEEHIKACHARGAAVRSPFTNEPMGEKLYPAPQHKNIIEASIENGVVEGELAEQWNKKMKEKEKRDEVLIKAESGDGCAQYELAQRYVLGKGFVQDQQLAFKWYKKAHESGNLCATTMLGHMLNNGAGVEACNKKGNHYVALAAGQGCPYAAYLLGFTFAEGRHGLPVDRKEAIRWFKKYLNSEQVTQGWASGDEVDKARAKLQELENESP